MRGEKLLRLSVSASGLGSPPLARGKAIVSCKGFVAHRITPACAGKRQRQQHFSGAIWDHPRLCGEKRLNILFTRSHEGSPPLVRGKAFLPPIGAFYRRITPACAGKRGWSLPWYCRYEDHPRLCGEKNEKGYVNFDYLGSPPLVRGKEIRYKTAITKAGITPACAGKSQVYVSHSITPWDHPRLCGEKSVSGAIGTSIAGSHPLVRGKGSGCIEYRCSYRITPACAGKSQWGKAEAGLVEDHPRLCGEKPESILIL